MANDFLFTNPHLFIRHVVSSKRHELSIIIVTLEAVSDPSNGTILMTLDDPNCQNCFRFVLLARGQSFQNVRHRSSRNFHDW